MQNPASSLAFTLDIEKVFKSDTNKIVENEIYLYKINISILSVKSEIISRFSDSVTTLATNIKEDLYLANL